MKNRFSIYLLRVTFVLFLLSLLSIAATRDVPPLQEVATPDSDDVLAVFKSGSTQASRKIKIGNLVPKPSDAGLARDVWLAVRTDGKRGDGSLRNPFDGSTQVKFDQLMASFGQNTVIHLGPGTFRTDIMTRTWRPLTGWKIRGAGMDVTTIQAGGDLSAGGFRSVVGLDNGNANAVRSDNVEVSDLTVDGNWSVIKSTAPVAKGQPNFKLQTIVLMGSNNIVERVHAKNQYGSSANGAECFGIVIKGFADAGVVSGNVIRYCLVDNCQGDYNNAYCLAGSHNGEVGNQATGCEIHHCRAFGTNDGNSDGTSTKTALGVMVNIEGLSNSKIHDNICFDAVGLIHGDTGQETNVDIYNNQAFRSGGGISGLYGHVSSHIRFYSNYIDVQNRNGRQANYGIVFTGGSTDVEIFDNTFTYNSTGPGSTSDMQAIHVEGGTGTIKNNLIDTGLKSTVPASFSVVGNTTKSGGLPLGLVESLPLSRTNSPLGALKITAVVTSNPSCTWMLSAISGGNYTIQSGDKLRCEIMSDVHNPLHAAAITIQDPGDEPGLADQNGLFGFQDQPNAAGRWLYREFDLTSKAGNSLSNIRIGLRPISAPSGTYIFYYRNIEIVNSSGATQRTFLSPDTSPVIADDVFSSTTSHSVLAINRQVGAPSSSRSRGIPGEWAFDSNYIYMCTATDTWKRVATSSW